jgi:hypothetical protein
VKNQTTTGSDIHADGAIATVPTQSQSNLNTNTAGNNCVSETTEEDLYGDWLVVNRKKNQGKKTRVNTHEEKQDTQGKSKPIGKRGMFSHLADAAIIENSGTLFHAMESKFQPGESSKIPKVWTKKIKRARGMGNNVKEPNKPTRENPNK